MSINQPSLAALTDRLLQSRSFAGAETIGIESEVEPHEVLHGFHIDPRTAWTDAIAALKLFGIKDLPATMPADWGTLAASEQGCEAVPMAAGNFPQRVRELEPLVTSTDLTGFRPIPGTTATDGYTGLQSWINKQRSGTTNTLIANGVARLLGETGDTTSSVNTPVEANERAADMWAAGRWNEAVTAWLSQPDHPVVSFNRGMGLLFCGQAKEAIAHLRAAAEQLPDLSGWSHLARLYLALAQSRA